VEKNVEMSSVEELRFPQLLRRRRNSNFPTQAQYISELKRVAGVAAGEQEEVKTMFSEHTRMVCYHGEATSLSYCRHRIV
jgi:hypothetical protein